MIQRATYHPDLEALLPPIPADSIVSRSVPAEEGIRATLFGFAPGQELTEHTAAVPVLLQVVTGHLAVTAADRTIELRPGGLVHLAARLPHGVVVHEPTLLVLTMLQGA